MSLIKKIKTSISNFIFNHLSCSLRLKIAAKFPKYKRFDLRDYEYQLLENDKRVKFLREKIRQGEKIRVAFLVNWLTSWSAEAVLLKMLDNPLFEVSVIIAPTTIYEYQQAIAVYNENLQMLKQRYEGKVTIYEAYDSENDRIVDHLDKCDILFVPSNDEKIEVNEYKIYNILKRNILACYICYAYYAVKDDSYTVVDTPNLCWKVFIENELNLEDLKLRQPIKGANAVVTGYPKADKFNGLKKSEHERKKIIIAPHHSIHGYGLQSQFLKYSDLFLKLPQMYPQVDFIFRPHPLLYNTLEQPQYWGKDKTKDYFDKISSYSNCIYDTTPNYYQIFMDSDGIIHDCGSFLPEYLYTDNPACYTLRDDDAIDEYFGPFGKGCLDCYYKAFDEHDIINYIENVVIKGKDILAQDRKNFADTVVKYNFPNAADAIVKYIEKELLL